MRKLAAEGRTVFVSSHLMSEMALTADHLLVIGRGRLLADTPLSELIARNSDERVEVRAADPQRLAVDLRVVGAQVTMEPDGGRLGLVHAALVRRVLHRPTPAVEPREACLVR
jgi:ABC-2 type transport system ATP-binding protein